MTVLVSLDPARGEVIWEGESTAPQGVEQAISDARRSFRQWSVSSLDDRVAHVRAFAAAAKEESESLARTIAEETGKPLWEGRQEVASMIAKVEISIRAQVERAAEREAEMAFGRAVLRHRPHGVMAVLGPYNFPAHLPNGHIVPALLAGDTVVFKPSEHTPATGAAMAGLWRRSGLPDGVLNIVQGGRDTGAALVAGDIDGLLFTGSAAAGAHFRRLFADRPEVILALELGGNNPIIAWDGPPEAVASIVAQSAFITTGQRCSCARRLIVPDSSVGTAIIEAVDAMSARFAIGQWDDVPEPTIGPLISRNAAADVRAAIDALIGRGARPIRVSGQRDRNSAFISPAILDVTGIDVPDAEIFGAVLQVTRVASFDAAVAVANATRFGLAGGLISQDPALWRSYAERAQVGVLNWNRPTTGASGAMPFGGVGASGNHRPSAYYAADYCAYPVASFESREIIDLSSDVPGLL